jgi:hypothetical protein
LDIEKLNPEGMILNEWVGCQGDILSSSILIQIRGDDSIFPKNL